MQEYQITNHTKHVMHRLIYIAWMLVLLSCQAKTEKQVASAYKEVNSQPISSHSQTRIQMNSNVTIRLHEQTDEAITFALENSTEQPIYVSYLPPKEGDIATFLAYGLERRADTEGKFEPYGAGFHFVPNLSPIAPRTVVLFHLLSTSVKKGEYRVLVGYYDNIDIYKLVNEKAPNWTDVEKEKIKRAYRIASSDTFSISRGQSND